MTAPRLLYASGDGYDTMKAFEADEQEAGAVSSARLERLLHTQEVGGSSPPPPTSS